MGLCPETPIATLITQTLSDDAVESMWYDWFCKPESLVNKGRKLLTRLKAIAPSPRFDAKKNYVFFKNNCPLDGKLYDDFRICDIKTGDVVFCVVPREGYSNTDGQACVWGNNPDTGKFGELVRGTWKDVKLFFSTTDEKVLKDLRDWAERVELMRKAEYENRVFDDDKATRKTLEKWVGASDDAYISQLEYFLGR